METFLKELLSTAQTLLDNEYILEYSPDTKNNHFTLPAVKAVSADGTHAFSLSLGNAYEVYKAGRSSVPEIAGVLANKIREGNVSKNTMPNLSDYNAIKDSIKAAVINYEANLDYLKERPHVQFLDLAIVFIYNFPINETINGTLHISNRHLKEWNMDSKNFIMQHLHNISRNAMPFIMDTTDFMLNIAQKLRLPADDPILQDLQHALPGKLFTFSLYGTPYGAGVLLHTSALQKFAEERNANLFIFPSSIYEILVQPETAAGVPYMTAEDVADINLTQVRPDERLSNSIYYYDRHARELTIYEQGISFSQMPM